MPEMPQGELTEREVRGVQYRRYKVKSLVLHCDVCVENIARSWGKEPTHAPNRAAWKRVTKEGETMLCFQHCEEDREKDHPSP